MPMKWELAPQFSEFGGKKIEVKGALSTRMIIPTDSKNKNNWTDC